MGLQRTGSGRGAEVQPGGAPPRLKVRRDAEGKLVVGDGPAETHPEIEAAERPPTPDDPRTGPLRNVPPIGGA